MYVVCALACDSVCVVCGPVCGGGRMGAGRKVHMAAMGPATGHHLGEDFTGQASCLTASSGLHTRGVTASLCPATPLDNSLVPVGPEQPVGRVQPWGRIGH